MSVKFEFSGSWEYDGGLSTMDPEELARHIRSTYDPLSFFVVWNVADQIIVTVDGEKVFGP